MTEDGAMRCAYCALRAALGIREKFGFNFSANQKAKMPANERQKNMPVHRNAFPAVVMVFSSSGNLDCLKRTMAQSHRTDIAMDQFEDGAIRFAYCALRAPSPTVIPGCALSGAGPESITPNRDYGFRVRAKTRAPE